MAIIRVYRICRIYKTIQINCPSLPSAKYFFILHVKKCHLTFVFTRTYDKLGRGPPSTFLFQESRQTRQLKIKLLFYILNSNKSTKHKTTFNLSENVFNLYLHVSRALRGLSCVVENKSNFLVKLFLAKRPFEKKTKQNLSNIFVFFFSYRIVHGSSQELIKCSGVTHSRTAYAIH